VVYLHKSVPHLQKNIRHRGRPYEKEIPDDYLSRLENGYMKFFAGKQKPEVRIINTDEVDFVHQPAHLQDLLAQIFNSP
jgi:deoxyadenosine/deoxycytidine kinase